MDFLIAISIISFALLVSAFISASESSIIAVNKIRIKHLDQEEGNKRAAAVSKILEQHDYFFGSILLIGNIMNILIATVSTSFIISVLGQNSGFAIILASIITTLLVVIFGELTPKTIATVTAEKWSLSTVYIIRFLMIITTPLVFLFTLIPNTLLKIMGRSTSFRTPALTTGELRMMIDMGEEEGTVQASQGEMLENIFRFGETEVKEVMTPRNNIEWVHSETILEDFLSKYKEHPHSRFPVYEDEYDDVIGILSTKDVVTSIAQGNLKPKDPIIRIMRAALFVPEAKRLDELFTSMRQSGHKIALVVDEFGGVSGLMTLSKVIEQIVGTTGEEGLSPKERFITIDTDTYEIEASMPVDEANNLLELNIPEGDYETIAGFILETAQSIPSIGKRLRYGDLRMTVTSMEGNKLEKVRIRKRPNLYE